MSNFNENLGLSQATAACFATEEFMKAEKSFYFTDEGRQRNTHEEMARFGAFIGAQATIATLLELGLFKIEDIKPGTFGTAVAEHFKARAEHERIPKMIPGNYIIRETKG